MDRTHQSQEPDDPRVRLAGERTLLAWVRTSLGLMGFGFVVARFGLFLRELALASQKEPPRTTGWSLGVGTGLVLLGVSAALLAAAQHWRFLRRLDRGEPYHAPRWSPAIAVAVILALLGVGMAAYLVYLRA